MFLSFCEHFYFIKRYNSGKIYSDKKQRIKVKVFLAHMHLSSINFGSPGTTKTKTHYTLCCKNKARR